MDIGEQISLASVIVALVGTFGVSGMTAFATYSVLKYRMDRLEKEVEQLSEKHFRQIYEQLGKLNQSVSRIEGKLGIGE